MLAAFDLDGTISAYPYEMGQIMSSLMAAGHTVIVITGQNADEVTQDGWNAKATYLQSLGCGECWHELIVLPDAGELPELKADYLASRDANFLCDNNVSNVKAANAKGIMTLVPWAAKVK